MLAAQNFNAILDQIHLQVSPFSAVVSLKKTFINDKSGKPLLPQNRQVSIDDMKKLIDKN